MQNSFTNKKLFWYAGLAAVFMYLIATIFGGFLFPDYSHTSQAISELVGNHASTRALLNPIYLLYNLLLISFAYGLFRHWSTRLTKLGAIFLIILGIASILMWWFPMDTRGYPVTRNGVIHIVLAAIESLLTVAATFLFWLGLRKEAPLLSRTSFYAGTIIIITGPMAGYAVAHNNAYAGLLERLTIGAFLLWVVLISLMLLKRRGSK